MVPNLPAGGNGPDETITLFWKKLKGLPENTYLRFKI